jgi:hypothetical protein
MSKSLTFKGTVKDYEKYLNERKEPIEEPIEEPEKKHKFTEKAREENKNKYQQLRKGNLELTKLNKMYNITKNRNEILKTKLKNNPLFSKDYKRILEAFNKGVKIDNETLKIIKLFNLEPLTDEDDEEDEYY